MIPFFLTRHIIISLNSFKIAENGFTAKEKKRLINIVRRKKEMEKGMAF